MTRLRSKDMDQFLTREYRARKTPIIGEVAARALLMSSELIDILPLELNHRSKLASSLVDKKIIFEEDIVTMAFEKMITPLGKKIENENQLAGALKSVADGAVAFIDDATWLVGGALLLAEQADIPRAFRSQLVQRSSGLLAFGMIDMDEAVDVKLALGTPYISPEHLTLSDGHGTVDFSQETMSYLGEFRSIHGGCPAHKISTPNPDIPNLMEAGWQLYLSSLVTPDVQVSQTL